jgi:putative nucleotidyltransferase with HDIG domain
MMRFLKKASPRRDRVRKNITAERLSQISQLANADVISSSLLWLLFVVLCTLVISLELILEANYLEVIPIAIIVVLICLAAAFYIYHYQGRIIKNHIRASALVGLFILLLATTKIGVLSTEQTIWATGTAVIAAIILTIAYNQRFAIGMGIFYVVLACFAVGPPAGTRLFLIMSAGVISIAEAAAEAIGRNGLLCRVGAYYHDIGKINKAGYFVENEMGSMSRHKELSPAMSHLIIVGHVKDGIEMAREYSLPAVLRQFIETHHGTTLVEYFYNEAKKKRDEKQSAPSESEFRYAGPKPQIKEAAIVMLADGVEGAARSLTEVTPTRIEAVVHNMSMKRLQDGQFDECDLSLRELSQIGASISKTLAAHYHGRVAYPKSPDVLEEPILQGPHLGKESQNGNQQKGRKTGTPEEVQSPQEQVE